MTSNDLVTLPIITTSTTSLDLHIQMPSITVVEWFFEYRVHTTCLGTNNKYTANIKIRMVNCAYTALSLISPLATPFTYFVYDVTDTTAVI
jgi:hypothetical protein